MCLRGRRGWVREGGGKGLVCISVTVLRVCFLVSVLVVEGGIRYTLVVCSIKSWCESHSWFGNLG